MLKSCIDPTFFDGIDAKDASSPIILFCIDYILTGFTFVVSFRQSPQSTFYFY